MRGVGFGESRQNSHSSLLGVGVVQVRIVLVEPQGSRNVGSVARVMKNMGLSELVLVRPRCDPQAPEARQMAVHGAPVLEQAVCVASLGEALADCQRTLGTLGRTQNTPPEWQIGDPRQVMPWLLAGERGAMVFGPEDRGLSNAELAQCQRQITIPTHPDYPSLNVAQAVGICVYELWLAQQGSRTLSSPSLTHAQQEGFFQHLEDFLLQIGYLQPQTARRKMQKFRALLHRAQPTPSELALLRGILRQWQWYTQTLPLETEKRGDP